MGKKSANNLCPHCNVPQDVLHVSIHCDYHGVKKKRKSFFSYARNYTEQSETGQIRELLNIVPNVMKKTNHWQRISFVPL